MSLLIHTQERRNRKRICPTRTQIYIQHGEDWFLPVLSPLIIYTHVRPARAPDMFELEQGGWQLSWPCSTPQTPTANADVLSTEHFQFYGGYCSVFSVKVTHHLLNVFSFAFSFMSQIWINVKVYHAFPTEDTLHTRSNFQLDVIWRKYLFKYLTKYLI